VQTSNPCHTPEMVTIPFTFRSMLLQQDKFRVQLKQLQTYHSTHEHKVGQGGG